MEKIYLSKEIRKILESIDYSRLGDRVAIKLHFGERGCTTYINPELVKKIYEKIKSLGKKVTLVECNVLYRGSRTVSSEHIETAKEHGFTFSPIEILDGENGQDFLEVDTETRKVKLGRGIKKYDSMIVLSHFTGHIASGFGGSLKNMGMGLGSRAGKLAMHSGITPYVNKNNCTGCGTCIENCNAKAISLLEGKAKIDKDLCEGCTMCIAVCPQKAINLPWHEEKEGELQKRIVDYVDGIFRVIPKEKIIFINVLENITKDCDCFGIKQEKVVEDIGILAGNDIVAVDKASLDLVNEKFPGFESLNPSGKTQLDYAEEKGLGVKEYEIQNLD